MRVLIPFTGDCEVVAQRYGASGGGVKDGGAGISHWTPKELFVGYGSAEGSGSMKAGMLSISLLLAVAATTTIGTAWARESNSNDRVAARVSAAPPDAPLAVSPTREGRSHGIHASGTISSTDITESIPSDPQAAAFDFYERVQPLTPALIHETDPAVYHIEDHVYTIWLERGEDALFAIDGPDTPSVNLDLYVYPPGTTDFSDDSINFPDADSDEGIQIDDVIAEGYWFVRVNSSVGTGGYDYYDFYWYFESPDDEIPGVPLPAPVTATRIDEFSDSDDVFSLWLSQGEAVSIRLDYPLHGDLWLDLSPELYLFPPGSTSIWTDEAAAVSTGGDSFRHRLINYTAPVSGLYYVDIYQPSRNSLTTHADVVTLTVKRSQPVYRFYNFTNNTHFFTPSEDEANNVIDRWSDIFEFEGVAYYTNPDNNTQPLYRFFNRNSGSHFYTASLDEANYVMATWPHIFTFDGPTYSVSPSPVASSVPVYRFFNLTNGSHFYTASAEEADMVIATWPSVYRFEGPAFWIGQ